MNCCQLLGGGSGLDFPLEEELEQSDFPPNRLKDTRFEAPRLIMKGLAPAYMENLKTTNR